MLRKLFKPIMATVLTMSVLLSAGVPVMASGAKHFSKDTVITESNLNDVLKAHNIDPSTIVKNTGAVAPDLTVGDFEASLEKAQKTPKKMSSYDVLPTASGLPNAALITPSMSTMGYSGIATGYRTTAYTESLRVTYSATGNCQNGMWVNSVTSDYTALATYIPTSWWVISSKYRNWINIYNAGSPNAYLKMTYSYRATNYQGVLGYGIPMGSIDIVGDVAFDNSYI